MSVLLLAVGMTNHSATKPPRAEAIRSVDPVLNSVCACIGSRPRFMRVCCEQFLSSFFSLPARCTSVDNIGFSMSKC